MLTMMRWPEVVATCVLVATMQAAAEPVYVADDVVFFVVHSPAAIRYFAVAGMAVMAVMVWCARVRPHAGGQGGWVRWSRALATHPQTAADPMNCRVVSWRGVACRDVP